MDIFSTLFGNLEKLGKSYAIELFSVTSPYTLTLFSSFFGIWVVWFFISLGIRGRLEDGIELFKKALLFILVIFALKSNSFYWDWFYTPLLNLTQNLSCLFLKATGSKSSGESLQGIIQSVESGMEQVWGIVKALWAEAGIFGIGNYFSGLIVLLCFAFMMCLFLAYTLELLFSLLAITALSPLLIVACAFSCSRPFTLSALRIVLNGIFTVLFASIAMGFTLSSIQMVTGSLPLEGGSFSAEAADFTEKGMFPLIVVGFIGILFHLKASALASALSSVHLGGSSAALVSGAGVYAWTQMKSASLGGLGHSAEGLKSSGQYLIEKFKNNPFSKPNLNEGIEQ